MAGEALHEGLHKIGAPDPARIRAIAHPAIDRTFYSDWQDISSADFAANSRQQA